MRATDCILAIRTLFFAWTLAQLGLGQRLATILYPLNATVLALKRSPENYTQSFCIY